MEIKINISDEDVEELVREYWYKQGKRQAKQIINEHIEIAVPDLVDTLVKRIDIHQELKDSIDRIFDRYQLRQLQTLKKDIKKVEKAKKK